MSQNKNKKRVDEWRIFNFVYGSRTNLTVMHEDKPDFWIKNECGDHFGVEVTQLFINESDARLKKIKGYSSDLLESRNYRHKDDKDNLTIDNIEIISKDNNRTETVAIIQELPDREKYLSIIANSLIEKNQQLQHYNKDLNYHNLIIDDNLTCLSLQSKETFYNFIISDEISNLLIDSNFHEVFLVTTLLNERLYFPLKRILLLSNILLFEEVLKELYQSDDISERKYFNWLGEFLIWLGFKNVTMRNSNAEFELKYSSTGYMINQENIKNFRDYDLDLVSRDEFHNVRTFGFITPQFKHVFNTVKGKFSFTCTIGYPIYANGTNYE